MRALASSLYVRIWGAILCVVRLTVLDTICALCTCFDADVGPRGNRELWHTGNTYYNRIGAMIGLDVDLPAHVLLGMGTSAFTEHYVLPRPEGILQV